MRKINNIKSRKNTKKNVQQIIEHIGNNLKNFSKFTKFLSKKNKNKNKNKKGGNSCTVNNNPLPNDGCNTSGMSTCIPNVNVEQYKCPCNFLPLDGTKQNVYPLSHNPKPGPPVGITTGGKKKTLRRKNKKNKRKSKKGGNYYLSVNNDTSAYTRFGAPGKCCGPNWDYANIKAGKKTGSKRKSKSKNNKVVKN